MKRQNILAHRGLWTFKEEQNSLDALRSALDSGFGIETDLRDHNGYLVVSHDFPSVDDAILRFDDLLQTVNQYECAKMALNVKADGLLTLLSPHLSASPKPFENAFFFDMSVPDMLPYIDSALDCFARNSEYEKPIFTAVQIEGYWIDDFKGRFDQVTAAESLLAQNFSVAIVSSELHGRNPQKLWEKIKTSGVYKDDRFHICTDLPFDFEKFVKEI